MENISNYLIKDPKKVLAHLKTLALQKCLISADFGEHHTFITAILDFDEKNKTMTIDCGPKEYLNKALLSAQIVKFKTEYNGIKVLFEGRGLVKGEDAGQPSLSMKIPSKLYWIQRRQFYRTRSPFSKNSYCSFVIQGPEDSNITESYDFKVYDLSATGFSVLTDTLKLAKPLKVNDEFNNCNLVLDGAETLVVSFSIRNILALNPNKLKKYQRVGCEFINANQRIESAVLRYMQNIERDIKKTFS